MTNEKVRLGRGGRPIATERAIDPTRPNPSRWRAVDNWRHMQSSLVNAEGEEVGRFLRLTRNQDAQQAAADHNARQYLRAVLQDLRANIEWTQGSEARGHFTVNRPMAEIAQYYAEICMALAAEKGFDTIPVELAE